MRGCLECVTLYERDLVGQADHAPESPRPRGTCAMRGCLPWVCTNAIWSVRRITRRNRYDRGGVRDARVFAVGLYKRDLVGQADHAPKSLRPRRCTRCSVFAVVVQTRSGRSGGSRAGIATITRGRTFWVLRLPSV